MEISGKKCRKCKVPEAGMASYVQRGARRPEHRAGER